MKRQILVNGLLSLTAVSLMTGCVDNKYDLSDIDTTSRFTIKDLTVPVNLSQIKLENVIDFNEDEDDSLIKTEDGKYVISRGGNINPTEFNLGTVEVAAPYIAPSSISLPVAGGIPIPVLDKEIPLPATDPVGYKFEMSDINDALKVLKNVKTANPISINVELAVPSELLGAGNKLSFKGISLQLPWGLISDDSRYDKTGLLEVDELLVDANGKANINVQATGLELGDAGNVNGGNLTIEGTVQINSATLCLNVNNVTLPTDPKISVKYTVSGFKLASFSGDIDYNMNTISIQPIVLDNLPDFLDNPQTNLIIANPQILVDIHNPVAQHDKNKTLKGEGKIMLYSNFKGTAPKSHESNSFYLVNEETKLAFCTAESGYETVGFDGLKEILTNGNSGLPESIDVKIQDIRFRGSVEDFPVGDLGSAYGTYKFNAPLAFGAGSKVIYETTESGWSSNDLDKVNINNINLEAKCTTDLPVSIHLQVVPIDKNGNEIEVKENSGFFKVGANAHNEPVVLTIEGKNGRPIKDFDGVKFIATIKQDSENTEALGPNLFIDLKDLRVTVDGYYETDF